MDFKDLFSEISSSKTKVLLRGPVLTQSGYGVHARQIAKWLLEKQNIDLTIQPLPWGDTPWILNKDFSNGLIGKIIDKSYAQDDDKKLYDVTVQVQLPNEWDPSLGKQNIGITAGVETDRCNPEWVNSCNKMNLVIVPSEHAKNSLSVYGNLITPIKVIPESFSDEIINSSSEDLDLELSTDFNFLIFGQITGGNPENERKNIFYTIKWLCESFKNDKDVGIVVKTNFGRNTPIDRKLVDQTFKNLISEVRGEFLFPKIHLIHGDLNDKEVGALYKHPKIKSLVSLTKGEGYGLPILEAAATGLPVIATGWSGHLDFLNHGKFISIDYSLNEIHPSRVDNKIFIKGAKWAIPNEADFKRKVTKFKNASSLPREWSKELKEKIIENYSHDSIAKMYNDLTREII